VTKSLCNNSYDLKKLEKIIREELGEEGLIDLQGFLYQYTP